MMPAIRSMSVGAVLLVASWACSGGGGGGGGGGPTGPNPGGPSASASVSMNSSKDAYGAESNSFSPTTVSITKNGIVTWNNATGVVHNVTFSGGGAPSNIADHSSGSNQRTFANSGSFSYSCGNHAGMGGTVTVQ